MLTSSPSSPAITYFSKSSGRFASWILSRVFSRHVWERVRGHSGLTPFGAKTRFCSFKKFSLFFSFSLVCFGLSWLLVLLWSHLMLTPSDVSSATTLRISFLDVQWGSHASSMSPLILASLLCLRRRVLYSYSNCCHALACHLCRLWVWVGLETRIWRLWLVIVSRLILWTELGNDFVITKSFFLIKKNASLVLLIFPIQI